MIRSVQKSILIRGCTLIEIREGICLLGHCPDLNLLTYTPKALLEAGMMELKKVEKTRLLLQNWTIAGRRTRVHDFL